MKRKALSKRVIVLATVAAIMTSTVAMAQEINKDETVYVILDSNGKPEQKIVSTWINGEENLGEFKDKCNLDNIKNVKGEESPAISGDELTWKVDGKDLYYEGESKRELPILVNLNYEIDGKKVEPKEALGQSGKFKITLTVKNNESRTAKINGENKTLYVPFVTVSEIMLSNDNFKDVKVDNGKLIQNGNNSSITFVSAPGLKESLNLGSILDIKDTLVIEGTTTNFSVPAIMMVATTEALDLENISGDDSLDSLKDSLEQLQNGGDELLEGSKKLVDGQEQLSTNYAKFNDGIGTFKNGVSDLSNGIDTLSNNTPSLKAGADKLQNGLSQFKNAQGQFSEGMENYEENATKLFTAYNSIDGGINSCLTGSTQLKMGLAAGSEGLENLNKSTANLDAIAAQLDAMGASVASVNPELAANIAKASGGIKAVSNGQKDGIGKLQQGMKGASIGAGELEEGLTGLSKGSEEFKNKGELLLQGTNTLKESSVKLNGASEELYNGSTALSQGVGSLVNGTNKLKAGGSALLNGSNALYDNSGKLLNGINQLKEGNTELYKGVVKLKEEGLDKLNEKGNTAIKDIEGVVEAKDELVKLSKEYGTFSGLDNSMNGKVKFIMRTEEVKADTDNKAAKEDKAETETVKEEKGFFKSLLNIFKK
ncbi:hypothetical protein GCM10008908_05670 [Clostridium subterminale]|uniref:X-X-X-Leu-X-X-Gly heptad repeats n=1 Tax=Clostridium subterminale TaxID=1550 RepID=A0ABN1KHK3_CLOSU